MYGCVLQYTSLAIGSIFLAWSSALTTLNQDFLVGSGATGRTAGPARKLGLVQGFARGLAGPLKLGAGQALPAEGGPAGPSAQPAACDAEFSGKAPEQLAMQRHSMLSPRGRRPQQDSPWLYTHEKFLNAVASMQHDPQRASKQSSVQARMPCACNGEFTLSVPVPCAARPWPFVSKEASPQMD